VGSSPLRDATWEVSGIMRSGLPGMNRRGGSWSIGHR